MQFLYLIVKDLILLVPLLIAVAYFTLLERKVLASMQRRRGPNIVGVVGLLQPFADGLKLFIKELIVPSRSNKILFFLAPIFSLLISFLAWLVIPLKENVVLSDLNLGILWILMCSSLGVYGIILSGWSSNSKFAFLGCLRSCAQMVSYEVSLSIILLQVIILSQSTNLTEIVLSQAKIWFVVPLFPFFLMWVISAIAETNRPPFDLPEAEAELVAGYSVEYGSMGFAYFFIAEYANIILMGILTVILFLGGWLAPLPLKILYVIPTFAWLAIKLLFCLFLFIWVRAAFPRYRFDQLMHITWRLFLPLSLCGLVLVLGIVYGFY